VIEVRGGTVHVFNGILIHKVGTHCWVVLRWIELIMGAHEARMYGHEGEMYELGAQQMRGLCDGYVGGK
jgi:hypothetical protein